MNIKKTKQIMHIFLATITFLSSMKHSNLFSMNRSRTSSSLNTLGNSDYDSEKSDKSDSDDNQPGATTCNEIVALLTKRFNRFESPKPPIVQTKLSTINMMQYFQQCIEPSYHLVPEGKQYANAIIPYNIFLQTMQAVTQLNTNLNSAFWIDYELPEAYNPNVQFPFEAGAYLQKKILPTGSEIIFIGDLHGNIHGLINVLSKLIIDGHLDPSLNLKSNTYMVFLGDMVDYGLNGCDTLFTALQLKLRNPENVFLCRGNHEHISMFSGSFSKEVKERYSLSHDQLFHFNITMSKLCSILPFALFLGIESKPDEGFIQCCHGAIETAAKELIKNLLSNERNLISLCDVGCFSGSSCGFNWNDVSGKETLTEQERWPRWQGQIDVPNETKTHCQTHTLIEIKEFCSSLNIRGLIRGHADCCDPFKVSIPGVSYPIYPFHKHRSEKHNDECRSFFYPKAETDAIILSGINFLEQKHLYETGFLIKDFMYELDDTICVLTFSNAGPYKGLQDDGCGIITVGESWEKSRMRGIILPIA